MEHLPLVVHPPARDSGEPTALVERQLEERACAGVGPLVPVARSPEDELARLFALGIAYVVVHPEYAKESCARTVSQRLGEPTLRQGRIIAWDLGAVVEQLEGGRR
jgi:hypothetical protein